MFAYFKKCLKLFEKERGRIFPFIAVLSNAYNVQGLGPAQSRSWELSLGLPWLAAGPDCFEQSDCLLAAVIAGSWSGKFTGPQAQVFCYRKRYPNLSFPTRPSACLYLC